MRDFTNRNIECSLSNVNCSFAAISLYRCRNVRRYQVGKAAAWKSKGRCGTSGLPYSKVMSE